MILHNIPFLQIHGSQDEYHLGIYNMIIHQHQEQTTLIATLKIHKHILIYSKHGLHNL